MAHAVRPSRQLEAGITLLGLLGLALFLAFYDRVFPSASIDLDLSRAEIAGRAQSYLQEKGYDLHGYETALSFRQDRWGSIYLQRTLGIPETNRLIRAQRLPIWYWHARWFLPLQKEEFSVYLSPDGQIVAFFHSLPEEAPGANLLQDRARALAEEYLTQDRSWVLSDWQVVAASSEERPGGRMDHHFEWRRRDFAVEESELRLAVDVQGDRVDGYDYWLKVPEAFQRHFLEQRDRASFFGDLSTSAGFFVFSLAAFAAYLLAAWRGTVSWSAGLIPALVVAVVAVLAGLNALPLNKILYTTTEDYALFWLERVFKLVLTAGYTAAAVLVLWVGGQRLSKRVWPRQDKILPHGEERWIILARSTWRGLMLTGVTGGYLILFYLAATRLLGGWMPLDIPDADLFATPLPFLAPLEVALLPAMTEELMFRLVGVSLMVILLRRSDQTDARRKRRWLALLVPGALWGFAHLGYVRDPFFLRGIELTIAAVFLQGLFFWRFDLATTIVAHFSYNAGLTALPLLRSGEPYFVASGGLVVATMFLPILPGALQAVRRRLRDDRPETILPQVRPAMGGDLERLPPLPVPDADWAALLNDPAATVICLEAAGELIGAGVARVTSDKVGEVLSVYVVPEWRRRYWGSRLVDVLCARLRERGVEAVQTTVETDDRIAGAFWASQGWHPSVKLFRLSFAPARRRPWRDVLMRSPKK